MHLLQSFWLHNQKARSLLPKLLARQYCHVHLVVWSGNSAAKRQERETSPDEQAVRQGTSVFLQHSPVWISHRFLHFDQCRGEGNGKCTIDSGHFFRKTRTILNARDFAVSSALIWNSARSPPSRFADYSQRSGLEGCGQRVPDECTGDCEVSGVEYRSCFSEEVSTSQHLPDNRFACFPIWTGTSEDFLFSARQMYSRLMLLWSSLSRARCADALSYWKTSTSPTILHVVGNSSCICSVRLGSTAYGF